MSEVINSTTNSRGVGNDDDNGEDGQKRGVGRGRDVNGSKDIDNFQSLSDPRTSLTSSSAEGRQERALRQVRLRKKTFPRATVSQGAGEERGNKGETL